MSAPNITLTTLSTSVVSLIFLSVFMKTGMVCRMYETISDNLPGDMLEAHLITDLNSFSILFNIHTDGASLSEKNLQTRSG